MPADLPALSAIERAAATRFLTTNFPEMATASLTTEQPDLDHELVWVAVAPEQHLVGFALVQRLTHSAHLHELDVVPEHAGRGLGRALIGAVADWAQTERFPAVTLLTFQEIPWNGPYYMRCGFLLLDDADLPAELLVLRQAEAAHGLPVAARCCMALPLPTPAD